LDLRVLSWLRRFKPIMHRLLDKVGQAIDQTLTIVGRFRPLGQR
jgi:hypothetical protein